MQTEYRERLVGLSKRFAHDIYRVSRDFPKSEMHGSISQIRRAALSIPLNIVEGYSRGPGKSYRNFFQIAYGSAKESEFLLDFALEEGWFDTLRLWIRRSHPQSPIFNVK